MSWVWLIKSTVVRTDNFRGGDPMRVMKAMMWLAAALLTTASLAHAQSTTGTISGRVVDAQALPMPGATINAESPNLQGIRTVVTSNNGDYILTLLPPGTYKLTFELSGFERQERTVNLAPTQVLPLDMTMGPAAITETVTVVGRSADVLVQTAQVATNFSQDLLSTLPTTRDINAALLLAPSVHASGPLGGYSIAGSMSLRESVSDQRRHRQREPSRAAVRSATSRTRSRRRPSRLQEFPQSTAGLAVAS